MTVGQKVFHPKYGAGVVIYIRPYSGKGYANIAVKFDGGGPQGFACNATNDIKDLQLVN